MRTLRQAVALGVAAFTLALLTSMPPAAAAPPDGPNWIQDRTSACWVHNPSPKPGETISWSGPCEGGYASGQGTLVWYEKGQKIETDTGTWKAGKGHGHLVHEYLDGRRYETEMRDGIKQGRETYRDPSGTIFVRVYRDGVKISEERQQ